MVKKCSHERASNKRQIAAIFVVSATGSFLPVQLIYRGKSKRWLPKSHSPPISMSHLPQIIGLILKSVKIYSKKLSFHICPPKRRSLAARNTSAPWLLWMLSKVNEEMKRLCAKNNCELVIVPHNLTNKFQPLDISINQSAKKFISNKFNAWYADRVKKQLSNRVAPGDVKVSLKLSDLKFVHARWIVETHNHLKNQNDSIIKDFDAVRIREAIICAKDVFTRVENPFKWTETTTEFVVVFSLFFMKT